MLLEHMCSHRWLNCFAFFFFSLSASYKTGLFFKPTSEGRVHNVGQQIRASCWLHIASDKPTDKQSCINFPYPRGERETLVSLFFYSNIISQWENGLCALCVLRGQLVNKDQRPDNTFVMLILPVHGNNLQPSFLILLWPGQ